MGCLKGKKEDKGKDARYECKKCGGVAKKKGKICKPKKLKD